MNSPVVMGGFYYKAGMGSCNRLCKQVFGGKSNQLVYSIFFWDFE
jgi:hypothetical protein